MNVAILDDYTDSAKQLECFSLLQGHEVMVLNEAIADTTMLAAQIKDAEALVLIRERTQITESLLAQLPNLKLISQTGKVARHIDVAACTKYGVAVAEGIGSPIAPAELAWALIMNVVRQVIPSVEGMKGGKWQTAMGTVIHGKTIGIWGYGKIGQRIARYAKAFDAKVLVWGSEASKEKAVADGFETAATKEVFFSTADVVTLHLRLVPETTGVVTVQDLAMMKPTAAFINTARAELVAEGALLNSLKTGRPGFAGIDVYEEEPVYDKDYRLLKMPNVLCTPHMGYVEKESYELYFGQAFKNIVAFANGSPENIVNPELFSKE